MNAPKTQYCPLCAERLPVGAEVCPMCGAPVEASAGRPGAGEARPRLILLRVVTLLFSALLLFSVTLLPLLTRTLPERFIAMQLSLLHAPDSSGSLTLTVSSDDPALAEYLRGSRVTLKYSFSRSLLLSAGLDLMSSPVLSATVTLRDQTLGVCVPQLNDVYYTADLPALLNNLGFTVPETDTPAPSPATYAAVVLRYFSILSSAINEDSLTFEEDVPVTLTSGEELTCDFYTFTPSPDDVYDALREISCTLDHDKDMLAILTYAADMDGAVIPARRARENLFALSDSIYDNARVWADALSVPFVWTLAVEDGTPRQIRFAWGDFSLTLEPREGGLDLICRHSALSLLEGLIFHLDHTPGDGPALPTSPREDITDYSLLRLIALARELSDNVGTDILYAFGDILKILGL